MALDIYVGPLSRYIHGDWKTVGQQIAEAQGLKFVKITPRQGLISRMFSPKPDKIYRELLEQIRLSLSSNGVNDPLWDDSPEQPYVTDRPGWEGYIAFVAQLAYARNRHFSPPARAFSIHDLETDPAIAAEQLLEASPVIALLTARLYIPGAFSFSFDVGNYQFAPLSVMDSAVTEVCQYCSLDRTMIAHTNLDQVDETASFAEAALYGTSIFAKLVDEAVRRNLPVIVDY